MAKARRKKGRIAVKDMKYRNDPMIRFYEKTQDWLQDKGRPLIIGIGIVIGLLLVYAIGSYFFHYRKARAEAAFAQAFEKYNAPVQDSTVVTTAPPSGRTYSDEATKWQESAQAFEQLANDYSSYYDTIGRYYAGRLLSSSRRLARPWATTAGASRKRKRSADFGPCATGDSRKLLGQRRNRQGHFDLRTTAQIQQRIQTINSTGARSPLRKER